MRGMHGMHDIACPPRATPVVHVAASPGPIRHPPRPDERVRDKLDGPGRPGSRITTFRKLGCRYGTEWPR
ncbi:MAG: hypothetical protein QOD63_331 [Actinomycetota bacterium]|jgi:hypothetical protein|nr:hypothetical protein [Actinomycetota bacterium]